MAVACNRFAWAPFPFPLPGDFPICTKPVADGCFRYTLSLNRHHIRSCSVNRFFNRKLERHRRRGTTLATSLHSQMDYSIGNIEQLHIAAVRVEIRAHFVEGLRDSSFDRKRMQSIKQQQTSDQIIGGKIVKHRMPRLAGLGNDLHQSVRGRRRETPSAPAPTPWRWPLASAYRQVFNLANQPFNLFHRLRQTLSSGINQPRIYADERGSEQKPKPTSKEPGFQASSVSIRVLLVRFASAL